MVQLSPAGFVKHDPSAEQALHPCNAAVDEQQKPLRHVSVAQSASIKQVLPGVFFTQVPLPEKQDEHPAEMADAAQQKPFEAQTPVLQPPPLLQAPPAAAWGSAPKTRTVLSARGSEVDTNVTTR